MAIDDFKYIGQITRVEDSQSIKYRTDHGETTAFNKQKGYSTKPKPFGPIARYKAIEDLFLKAKEYNEQNPQSESAQAKVEHILIIPSGYYTDPSGFARATQWAIEESKRKFPQLYKKPA